MDVNMIEDWMWKVSVCFAAVLLSVGLFAPISVEGTRTLEEGSYFDVELIDHGEEVGTEDDEETISVTVEKESTLLSY